MLNRLNLDHAMNWQFLICRVRSKCVLVDPLWVLHEEDLLYAMPVDNLILCTKSFNGFGCSSGACDFARYINFFRSYLDISSFIPKTVRMISVSSKWSRSFSD